MAESTLAYVDPGSPTKFLHSWQRNIGGTNKEDQVWVPGEHFLATYTAIAKSVSTATAASHGIMVQADGTNYCRIRYIKVQQVTLAGAVATLELSIFRTSTAGTTGTAVTCRPLDAADTNPYGGSVIALPTVKGTEGDVVGSGRLALFAAGPTSGNMNTWRWPDDAATGSQMKSLIIGTGTANGFVLKFVNGIATATVDIEVGFALTSYL